MIDELPSAFIRRVACVRGAGMEAFHGLLEWCLTFVLRFAIGSGLCADPFVLVVVQLILDCPIVTLLLYNCASLSTCLHRRKDIRASQFASHLLDDREVVS